MKFNYFSILLNILPLGKSSVILQEAHTASEKAAQQTVHFYLTTSKNRIS
jgi:hypothetical protein